MQGRRISMEDAHLMADMPSRADHLMLGVFDGHAGKQAAHLARDHLIPCLEATEQWKQYAEKGEEVSLLVEAFPIAFAALDAHLKKRLSDGSGCTAVVALVTPTHIVCANLGDSRCVLGTDAKCRELSKDHKPDLPEETARIQAAGGTVSFGRLDSIISVSRALGDFLFKNNEALEAHAQKISSVPDVIVHERDVAKDDWLVLACDGLWDVLPSEHVIRIVRDLTAATKEGKLIVEEILDIALDSGSLDNITVVAANIGRVVV